MADNFFGGVAEGFSSSFNARKARESAAADRELRREQAIQNQQNTSWQQQFKERQAQALEQHRQRQFELQNKQLELQQRKADLDLVEGPISKIFDPSIPKPARAFMLKQLAPKLGISPDAKSFKDFSSMIGALDDQALADMGSSIKAMVPGAQPGQVQAFAKNIISGKMTLDDALNLLQTQQTQQTRQQIMGGSNSGSVPSQQVQTQRITDPTPMAQQQPGGNLPIPGMDQPTQDQPKQSDEMDPQTWRRRALELGRAGLKEDARLALDFARSLDQGKNTEPPVEAIDPDTGDTRYFSREDAIKKGLEVPEKRPVLGVDEQARLDQLKSINARDQKKLEAIDEKVASAETLKPHLNSYRVALDTGRFIPGTAGGVRHTLSRMFEFFGGDPEQEPFKSLGLGDPASADIMEAASNQMGLAMADNMSRLTNMSLRFVQDSIPNLIKTSDGNRLILELMDMQVGRSEQIGRLVESYIEDNNGLVRPPGKPSLFQEIDKLKATWSPIDEDLEERIQKAARKGAGVRFEDIIESAEDGMIRLGSGVKFNVQGKSPEGYPMIDIEVPMMDGGSQQVPVIWGEVPKDYKGIYVRGSDGKVLER